MSCVQANNHHRARDSNLVSNFFQSPVVSRVKCECCIISNSGRQQGLGSCRFQWCGFHSCTFSKNSLCNFLYISYISPSLTRFWLVMTQVLGIWFMQIFARLKKMHEPRTRCTIKCIYDPFKPLLPYKTEKLLLATLEYIKKITAVFL